MRTAIALQWMLRRPWVPGAASVLLHLAAVLLASLALVRPPEFSMDAGTGGAGGILSDREYGAEVEIEALETEAPTAQVTPPDPVEETESEAELATAPEVVETPAQPEPTPRPATPTPAATRPASGMARSAANESGTGSGGVQTGVQLSPHRNPPPPYPEEARRKRQEGVVVLHITVTAQGRVADVRIHRSSGYPLLDEAALRAVRRYRFQPATIGGLPVEAITIQPIRFDLKDRI